MYSLPLTSANQNGWSATKSSTEPMKADSGTIFISVPKEIRAKLNKQEVQIKIEWITSCYSSFNARLVDIDESLLNCLSCISMCRMMSRNSPQSLSCPCLNEMRRQFDQTCFHERLEKLMPIRQRLDTKIKSHFRKLLQSISRKQKPLFDEMFSSFSGKQNHLIELNRKLWHALRRNSRLGDNTTNNNNAYTNNRWNFKIFCRRLTERLSNHYFSLPFIPFDVCCAETEIILNKEHFKKSIYSLNSR